MITTLLTTSILFLLLAATGLRQARKRWNKSARRLTSELNRWYILFEAIPDGALVEDAKSHRILRANRAAVQITGWPIEELLGRRLDELKFYQDPRVVDRTRARASALPDVLEMEHVFYTASGQRRWGRFSITPLFSLNRHSQELLILFRDITDARAQAETLQNTSERLQRLVEETMDVPWQMDMAGKVLYVGPGVRHWGYAPPDFIGRPFYNWIHPEDVASVKTQIQGLVSGKASTNLQRFRLRLDSGNYILLESTLGAMHDQKGHILGLHGIARDLSEREDYEKALLYRASHDPLTELLNRGAFEEKGANLLARTQRGSERLAVIYIDLDNFKNINDQYGHQMGDLVLVHVARCLRQDLRSYDLAARMGGDEFAILLAPADESISERVIHRIHMCIDEIALPVPDLHPLRIGCSIGLAFSDPTDLGLETLLARADRSMYAAKKTKKTHTADGGES